MPKNRNRAAPSSRAIHPPKPEFRCFPDHALGLALERIAAKRIAGSSVPRSPTLHHERSQLRAAKTVRAELAAAVRTVASEGPAYCRLMSWNGLALALSVRRATDGAIIAEVGAAPAAARTIIKAPAAKQRKPRRN